MTIDKGILEHLPDGVIWAAIGAAIVYLARAIAWMLRKDRTSVDQKLIKIFQWLERHDKEISDNALLVAREYATKDELKILRSENRADHEKLEKITTEVRDILLKKTLS